MVGELNIEPPHVEDPTFINVVSTFEHSFLLKV
jgi:hypothetical protein